VHARDRASRRPEPGGKQVTPERLAEEVRAALAAAEDEAAGPAERAEMLMEIAIGLQRRPRTPDYLHAAVELYDKALGISPAADALLRARITARKGTALQAIPEEGTGALEQARRAFEKSIPALKALGREEEVAEAEMNLGLVLQSLSTAGRARLTDAIAAYQRALRTFSAVRHPQEFAILQNNLATAFLSIPFTDDRAKMREALAVQAFEEGLKVVTLIDHPLEYAMLQNNLGNALQYAASGHTVENNLRALDAYDEALKIRHRDTTPLEYANTIANKANCLWNLPDDPADPGGGNRGNLVRAKALYCEAREIFAAHGQAEKARMVAEAVDGIERELLALPTSAGANASAQLFTFNGARES
jgi:tetratricopeptide (TPR) repeat protein